MDTSDEGSPMSDVDHTADASGDVICDVADVVRVFMGVTVVDIAGVVMVTVASGSWKDVHTCDGWVVMFTDTGVLSALSIVAGNKNKGRS